MHNFLRSRRSSRRFKPDPVDALVLTRIIETATYAPSAHNRQPWRFAVIRQADSKTRLSEFLGNDFRKDLLMDGLPESEILAQLDRSKNRINESPVIIILCMDVSEMDVYMDGKRSWAEQTMAIQSVAAAGLQLQLAAHAEGLASVWTCAPLFSPHAVKLALDMPEHWDPQAMFFIGYSAGLPKEKKMKSLHEVVKYY